MHIFFVILASITSLLLSIAMYFGYNASLSAPQEIFRESLDPTLLHFFFGLIGTVSALITHTWVFFYFIGTGEGIREGVLVNKLDRSAIKKTKKFKGKTFPFALFSMLFLITTAILGGALRFGDVSKIWHQFFTYASLALNLFAFYMEFKTIQENRALTASLNAQIEANQNKATLSS